MSDPRNARGDRGLERLLRESLPPANAGGAACLDADTIAAWLDEGLTPAERAAAEAHAASCARCQSMLAVMVRTASAAPATDSSRIRRWTLMFAPALAAAAAVTLWFAVERPQAPVVPPQTAERTAVSAVGEPPVVPAPAAARPASPADAPMTQAAQKEAELMLADELRKNEDRARPTNPPLSGTRAEPQAAAVEAPLAKDARVAAAKPLEDARTRSAGAPAASPAPPVPPQAPPSRPGEPAAGGLAERVAVAQAPQTETTARDERRRPAPPTQSATDTQQQAVQQRPDQQQAAGFVARDAAAARRAETDRAGGAGAVAGGVAGGGTQLQMRAAASKSSDAVAFKAPDGSAWWRITGGRVIETSGDGGTTWSTRYTADQDVALTAGSAPSPSAIWIVGRSGLVLITTDGRTFRRAAFPETADLVAVTAVDARRASVVTADGRTFATADAGATWTSR